ncbi:sialate O-acetylesterase [Sphingomonas sp. LY29]|uniref:sialate O-acetylesterase n=1 Tax=Sphingomonas sp. LY29 TaxID=3095341 RepID=UPI002D797794|nr:sialate O-acetylesterase [Sphingomonas sp. LY29]WRP25664.1 sialate O-acetylesterase [Sphingomonas sp. LY29]
MGISPQTLTPQSFYGGVWVDGPIPLTTRNEINQWLRFLCGESDLDSLTYDVFIVAGQSNAQGAAAGFGTTPALGRGAYWSPWYTVNRMADPVRMLEDDVSLTGSAWPAFAEAWYVRTGNPVLIIGAAVSGCGLVTAGPDGLWGSSGNLTTRAANQALEALTYLGAQANLRGVIWAGGEQDAEALATGTPSQATYAAALVDLRDRFRTALDKPTLPMFMISADRRTDGTYDAGYVTLRAAQVAAGTADSGIKLVVPYQNFVGAGLMSDVVHWNQTAQNTVGTTAAGAIATHFGYA